MRILKEDTAGLFIDIQEKLFPHIADKEILERNLIRLLEGLRILEIPVLVTEQYTKGLGVTIPSLYDGFENTKAIEKMSFSCCGEPLFEKALKSAGKRNIILCGIETHVCVLQTALDLMQMGYQPVVIEDCVSSRNLNDKRVAIDRMRNEGAVISSLESILFELTRVSGTELFKSISKLVR